MQRDAAVPSVLVSIVEAILILAMVAGAGRSVAMLRARGRLLQNDNQSADTNQKAPMTA